MSQIIVELQNQENFHRNPWTPRAQNIQEFHTQVEGLWMDTAGSPCKKEVQDLRALVHMDGSGWVPKKCWPCHQGPNYSYYQYFPQIGHKINHRNYHHQNNHHPYHLVCPQYFDLSLQPRISQ